MEPTTSFQVPSFYGKNTAKFTENSEVDDQVVCESLLASAMNDTPDPDLLLNVSLNTSYSEDYSENMSNDQRGKNRKRKLIFESGNIKSVNANTNKGKKGKNKKIKLNSESEKDVLNVKSGSANILKSKGQKAKNSKNISGILDDKVLDLSCNTGLDNSAFITNDENVESEYNEGDLNVESGSATIIELNDQRGKNSNNLSGIFGHAVLDLSHNASFSEINSLENSVTVDCDNLDVSKSEISELIGNKKVKGKITIGQMVKNGRKNRDTAIEIAKKREIRPRNAKKEASYFEGGDNEILGDNDCDSEDEYVAENEEVADEDVDDDDDDDDADDDDDDADDDFEETTPKKKRGRGRPPGAKNKKSRKVDKPLYLACDDFENVPQEEVPQEKNDGTVNGESGCTSPPKKQPKTSRKRPRNPANWKRASAKRARDHGLPYLYKDKNNVVKEKEGRKIGKDCTCQNRCSQKLGPEAVQTIFKDFWALGNYDLQNCHLAKLIDRAPTLGQLRKGDDNTSRVKATNKYYINYQGERISVCKTAFLSSHGIPKSKVEELNKKRSEDTDTVIPDQRGRAGNHNQISEERKAVVYEHIESLPTRSSHYTRDKNPFKKYIDLPHKKSYEWFFYKYIEWSKEHYPNVKTVSKSYYKHIWDTCYNIDTRSPRIDVCDT